MTSMLTDPWFWIIAIPIVLIALLIGRRLDQNAKEKAEFWKLIGDLKAINEKERSYNKDRTDDGN